MKRAHMWDFAKIKTVIMNQKKIYNSKKSYALEKIL